MFTHANLATNVKHDLRRLTDFTLGKCYETAYFFIADMLKLKSLATAEKSFTKA